MQVYCAVSFCKGLNVLLYVELKNISSKSSRDPEANLKEIFPCHLQFVKGFYSNIFLLKFNSHSINHSCHAFSYIKTI